MGRDAALDIRQTCNNEKVVEKHLELRRKIVGQDAMRSLRLPVNLPWARKSFSDNSRRRAARNGSSEGIAIVVTCFNAGRSLNECLQSLKRQTRKPASVILIDDGTSAKRTLKTLDQARREGWQVVQERNAGLASAKNAGIQAVLDSGINPLGFAFLCATDRLQPGFIEVCESVLKRCPEVGLVSCWAHRSKDESEVWIKPCPSFPYQWMSNEAAPFSAVRTDALREAGNFRPAMNHGYEDWDLSNAVMAAGWVSVTVPEILVSHRFSQDTTAHAAVANGYAKARRELLKRFPDLIARDAKEIILLSGSAKAKSFGKEAFFLREHLAMARVILRHPRGPALRALGRLKNKMRRRTPLA
jgi:GT2 family glycosyltransferase